MPNRWSLTLERKKAIFGVLFLIPWLLGLILLLIVPLFQSIQFSLSKLAIGQHGYTLEHVGWDNFYKALYVDARYIRELTSSVLNMVLNVPLIIFFSLFSAVLLAQRFKGRMLARAIFFLPVVLASGTIASLDSGNVMAEMMGMVSQNKESSYSVFQGLDLVPLLLEAGMPHQFVTYLAGAVERIYQIVSASGVQILIFLAGLQSISPSLYEAARMEGATSYEAFWKITFPMISPLILVNTIYSIIDSFYNNQVTQYLHSKAFVSMDFGLSAAMAWIYFLIISVILVLVFVIISRKVFYQN